MPGINWCQIHVNFEAKLGQNTQENNKKKEESSKQKRI